MNAGSDIIGGQILLLNWKEWEPNMEFEDNRGQKFSSLDGIRGFSMSDGISRAAALETLVRPAVAADLDRCFEIEEGLRESRPQAREQGFLLSGGDPRENYDKFLELGSFYVYQIAGVVQGFLFLLPPDSQRMGQIIASQSRYEMDVPGIFDKPNLGWLAKVAVAPEHMRHGVASALFRRLLAEHNDWNLMTTTVRSPIRNVPSERLHGKFGFRPVGSLKLPDRGNLKDIVCTVHFRERLQEIP